MNRLPASKRAQILDMMVEGVSIRAISRMTGASKNTIVKLLADAGNACADYQDKHLRGLSCKRLQVDEFWSFVDAKAKNVPTAKAAPEVAGDVWTWTAICADTKLMPSFHIGSRDAYDANVFMRDVAERLAHRVQLTSDGHKAYLDAVERAFGNDIDYDMLVKHYGAPPAADLRRLTIGFSKKVENHIHALAIYFMHYNYVRIHQTLRVTPVMAAGVTDKFWSMDDMVRVVEDWEKSN